MMWNMRLVFLSFLGLMSARHIFGFSPYCFGEMKLVGSESVKKIHHFDRNRERRNLFDTERNTSYSKRAFIANVVFTFGLIPNISRADEFPTNLEKLSPIIRTARSQLDEVPQLIADGKWDSVRAILISPPISDCWSKSSKLLLNFANAVGEELPDGDELAALEARDELSSHLRYLDMAVYNNNFNPIATEGETGATKELIRSYYEDPKNELKASIKAFDELLSMLQNTKF